MEGRSHPLSATCGPGCRDLASAAPAPSALSLPAATARDSGAMPQLVQGWMRSASACFSACADRGGDLLRRLDRVRGDVDGADQQLLVRKQADQRDRHARVGAFERNLLDRRSVDRREDLLVLPPFGAERLLPLQVGLDAVAVADVDGGRAFQAARGALQRGDAPLLHVVHEDVEGRLVELDHVDAGGFEFQRLLVEDLGEGHRHVGAAAEMPVGERVADRHRAGQGEFQLACWCATGRRRPRRGAPGRLRFGLPVTVGTSTT